MKLEKVAYFNYAGGIKNISSIEDVTINIDIGNMNLKDYENLKKMEGKKVKLTLEVKEPILDEEERKYLSDVIRPFNLYKKTNVI